MKIRTSTAILLALSSLGGHAATLVSNPLFQPNSNNVLLNANDVTSADTTPEQQVADNFVVAGGGTARYVEWSGMYAFSPTDGTVLRPFEISFFNDNGGVPANSPFTSQTVNVAGSVVATNGFGDIYQYGAAISDVLLAAGTTYWIAVREADFTTSLVLPNRELWQWHIAETVVGETTALRNEFPNGNFQPWQVIPGDPRNVMAFSIYDAPVPEPGTFTLLLAGIAGWVSRRRR